MKIWVDADACPSVVRDILYRAADRVPVPLILVANRALSVPPSRFVSCIQVLPGFDVADNEIVRRVESGDLVITSDIPLAAEVLAKGALVLNVRGERFTLDNIGARLNMRDFMETMRSSGVHSGGPPPLSNADRKAFADQLDRLLAKNTSRPDPDPDSPAE